MKSVSKVLWVGVLCMFVLALFIQHASAESKTINRNQMGRIGMVRHADNLVEVFFEHQGKMYYFPGIEGDNSVTKGGELVGLVKRCKKIIINDFRQPATQSAPVAFTHYTFEF